MHSYILIDMSGSMAANWPETIGAVNTFVTEVAKVDPDRKINIFGFTATPDITGRATLRFASIREKSPASAFRALNGTDVKPDGYTPLYDAIGKLDAIVTKRDKPKATILVVTDGAENASVEHTGTTSRKMIDAWKAKGYDVAFMGVDWNAFGQAGQLGVAAGSVINSKAGNHAGTMAAYASRSAHYGTTGEVRDFTEEERAAAGGPSA